MAPLSTEALINDARWTFLEPVLIDVQSSWQQSQSDNTRNVLAAVVYVVMTDSRWCEIPRVLKAYEPWTVQHRFQKWTEAGLWSRLYREALSTPHARWVHAVVTAAIERACRPGEGGLFVWTGNSEDSADWDTNQPAVVPLPGPRARAAINRHHGDP
jgi:hypothetical protein